MGCDLVYSDRDLVQLRNGKANCCRVWYINSSTETSKTPISIRTSLGPNRWTSTYLFPPKGTRDLAHNKYYSIEGVSARFIFVDSSGDAWLFSNKIDFEAAIANYWRQGPSFHLVGAVHYSQVVLPKKFNPIANRYERIMKNMIVEPVVATRNPDIEVDEAPKPYDEIQEILDFEFNRPEPPKLKDPLGLDFEALIKEALKET
jgi:hypothetical protein